MSIDGAAELAGIQHDAAIEAFVAEHYDRLLGLARLICRDASDGGDAVQIGLELAWRRRTTLRDEASLRSWLDRIVMREAIRIAKRRQSRLARFITPRPDVTWVDIPDRRDTEPSTFVALRSALAQLSPEQRAVVALHLHLGYTIAETGQIVGAPEETVRSRLRLARQRLRREFEESAS